jgi:pteridine reductase
MSNQSLAGKTALITGGARRVGAAIARELHAAGANVAIHYRKSANDADPWPQSSTPRARARRLAVQADLLDIAKLPGLVEFTVRNFGALDVLVNNASTFHATKVGEITAAAWGRSARHRISRRRCSSRRPRCPRCASPGTDHQYRRYPRAASAAELHVYCTAKAGLHMLTRSLAKELGPEIRVNGIAPGPVLWPEGESDYQHAREDHRTHHPQAHGDTRGHRAHRAVLCRARPFHYRPDAGGGRRRAASPGRTRQRDFGTSIAHGVMTCPSRSNASHNFPMVRARSDA